MQIYAPAPAPTATPKPGPTATPKPAPTAKPSPIPPESIKIKGLSINNNSIKIDYGK